MPLIGLLIATKKNGSPRSTPYKAHTVAPQKQLEGPRISGKGDPCPQVAPPHLRWWLEKHNVLQGQPLHPLKHALQIFTEVLKEGWVLT